jgi:hypothetical protein
MKTQRTLAGRFVLDAARAIALVIGALMLNAGVVMVLYVVVKPFYL